MWDFLKTNFTFVPLCIFLRLLIPSFIFWAFHFTPSSSSSPLFLHPPLFWHYSKHVPLGAHGGHKAVTYRERQTLFRRKKNQCIPYWEGENSYTSYTILLWPQHAYKPIRATDWTQLNYNDWIISVCFIFVRFGFGQRKRERTDRHHLTVCTCSAQSVTVSCTNMLLHCKYTITAQ